MKPGISLRWYQDEAVQAVFDYFAQHGGRTNPDGTPVRANPVIALPTGCHAADTQILMYDGSTKAVQYVEVDDLLMGPDSRPRRVLQLARGREQMWRITPTKGEPFVVNANHILSLGTTNEGKAWPSCTTGTEINNVSVIDWSNKSKYWKHLRKLRRVAVDFATQPIPEIPAWEMGVLLGDGSLQYGPNVTTADFEIAQGIMGLADQFGTELRVCEKPNNKACTLFFPLMRWNRSTPNPLATALKGLGLYGKTSEYKFIPNLYKLGSRDIRAQVLAGLMDTDGCLDIACSVFDFISKSERLAADVVFVARSLGLAAYSKSCQKRDQNGNGGEYFRVCISGDIAILPTRIARKAASARRQIKDVLKTGFTAKPIGRDRFYGFALDGDHLYLTADFIVHHNTGKSLVNAALIERIIKLYPKQRFLMLVHVKELIEQNYNELRAIWPNAPVGIYSSGLRRKDTANQIIFGGVGSVANNIEAFGWRDIIIIDECHLLSPADGTLYQSIISRLLAINPWLRVIGLSATPFRMGLGYITDNGVFTDICYDISGIAGFRRLLDEGYLAPLIPKRTRTELDVSEVDISGGDFAPGALQAAVDKHHITYAALREMCEHGEDRQSWLVFTSGIEHSEHCADMLTSFGVPALAIHSKLKHKVRDERLATFKAGRVRAICGNNIFTTGFNHPPVDLIGMLRPTTSTGLWVQMLGRGTRPFLGDSRFYPKIDCKVLDFAGNTRRLGPIDDPVLPKKKGKGNGDPPCCICEACGTYNHARATICICCGAEIEHKPKILPTAGTEALLASDLPVYEWFPVLYMLAKRHDKIGSPPILQVTFITGVRRFIEWVSIERTGYAGVAAREWWRRFSPDEPPVSVDAALAEFSKLRQPSQIKVWVNRKYPEIVDYDFKPKGNDHGWGAQPGSSTAA